MHNKGWVRWLYAMLLLFGGICPAAENAAVSGTAGAVVVSGLTEPFLDVTLSSPVSGILRVELFKEGEWVNKGDVILELDKKLEEFEAARRKAIMDHNKADMESTQVLFKTTKAISRDEMSKREMEYNIAAADYGAAIEQLARRQIKAPFSGSISEVYLHSGAACEPYQSLVRVVDTKHCYFVGYVDGVMVSRLKTGQEVVIEVDGCASPVKAQICFISPVVEPASGLARIKALFENIDGKIRPGCAAQMHIK